MLSNATRIYYRSIVSFWKYARAEVKEESRITLISRVSLRYLFIEREKEVFIVEFTSIYITNIVVKCFDIDDIICLTE